MAEDFEIKDGVLAQFTSNIANASYPNATAFVTKHSPEVFKICIEFVKEM